MAIQLPPKYDARAFRTLFLVELRHIRIISFNGGETVVTAEDLLAFFLFLFAEHAFQMVAEKAERAQTTLETVFLSPEIHEEA